MHRSGAEARIGRSLISQTVLCNGVWIECFKRQLELAAVESGRKTANSAGLLRNGLCSPADCTDRAQSNVLGALSFRRRFCATAFVCNVSIAFFRLLQLNQGGRMETGPVCSEMDSAALQHAPIRHRGKYWVLSPFSAGPVQRRWDKVFQTLFREGCGQVRAGEWKLGQLLRNGLCSPAVCTDQAQSNVLGALSFRRGFCATAFEYNVPNAIVSPLQLSQGGRMETAPVCSEMDSAALQLAPIGHRGKYWVLSPFSVGPVQRRWDIVFQTLVREGCG